MRGGDDHDTRLDLPRGFFGHKRIVFTDAGRTAEEREMHDWVAQLTGLHHAHPALACGTEQTLQASTNSFAYMRLGHRQAERQRTYACCCPAGSSNYHPPPDCEDIDARVRFVVHRSWFGKLRSKR